CLTVCPDMARAVSRLAFGRGGPRDLVAVRGALDVAAEAARLLKASADDIARPAELDAIAARLQTRGLGDLRSKLAAALVDDPPHLRRDGGFVRAGYRADLDD